MVVIDWDTDNLIEPRRQISNINIEHHPHSLSAMHLAQWMGEVLWKKKKDHIAENGTVMEAELRLYGKLSFDILDLWEFNYATM